MPAFKYEKNNKTAWYCSFYYTDWNKQKHRKVKRGFPTKKEALEWERSFLTSQKYDTKTTIGSLIEDFLKETEPRKRVTTMSSYRNAFKNYIEPYFSNLPIGDLTEKHVIDWQNQLLTSGLSQTYIYKLDTIFRTLCAFGIRRCNITSNPFEGIKKIGKAKSEKMNFWTLDEYRHFINLIDNPMHHLAFELLFYTGIRLGELCALTVEDVNTETGTLRINKSLQQRNSVDIVTSPKTSKGNRTISLPQFLCKEIEVYEKKIYNIQKNSKLFPMSKCALYYPMKKYSTLAQVPTIRIHDLRHSHVALLIEQGVQPMIISERLGHESIDITLDTYGHLYPNKQQEIANILDNL